MFPKSLQTLRNLVLNVFSETELCTTGSFGLAFPKAHRLSPTHRKDRTSKPFSLVSVFLPHGCFGKDKVSATQFRALSDKKVFSISLQRDRMTCQLSWSCGSWNIFASSAVQYTDKVDFRMTFQKMKLNRKTNMASVLHKGNQQPRTIKRKLVLSFRRCFIFVTNLLKRTAWIFLKAKGYQYARVLHSELQCLWSCPMLEYSGIYITYNTVLKE